MMISFGRKRVQRIIMKIVELYNRGRGGEQMKNDKESKRELKVFSLASFLNDLGSDMIYPIWPLFVTVFLGADVVVLGLIDGIGDALVSISSAFSGFLSDKFRRRKIFVWTGYISSGVARFGYAISPTWMYLIPFKALDRAGKIRGAPRDAMIAELSSKDNRGANFGFLRAMDNFGAIVGITLSILLLKYLGFRNLILFGCDSFIFLCSNNLSFYKREKI